MTTPIHPLLRTPLIFSWDVMPLVLPCQVLDEDSDGAIDREEFRKGLRPCAVEIMVS